ncbi:biofilm regulation diguanylate cyclase SiaD [Thioalkalivibrio sp. ALJ1]|uniref:biofilm regulation diguanylate cyclase SiaD n=1 Tax=Thioalkalivibrio sp. ALJ1 TaxID=1158144 RepID=UPI00068E7CB1|nr:biofilm regulation diguanylate cyclase SiaD [Thioalkalivibrio sp. ALJ1]
MAEQLDPVSAETVILDRVREALEDPEHTNNPLREPLEELLDLAVRQRERMERLVRISDGFQGVAMEERESLMEAYDHHLRRLEKLVRISDRYHEGMRELSESLQEAALTDQLTGVGNRRYLVERLREEQDRARRVGRPLSLAMLDIDRFKRVNDRYGHEVGDQLLCRVAETVRNQLREYDIFGRWGGEEFLMLFPESGDDVVEGCERVLSAVRAIELPGAMKGDRITASIGLTWVDPERGYSEAINRADELLYRAKELGRDRIVQDFPPHQTTD